MPLKTQLSDAPAPNLTPMIDVVFLLIIFFMVGTNFTQVDHKITVNVNVPEVTNQPAALTAKPTQRVISVHADGHITLDNETVTLEQLEQKLKAAVKEYPQLGIIVRGAATGAFGNVAQVLSSVKASGVSEMDIAVRPTRSRSMR